MTVLYIFRTKITLLDYETLFETLIACTESVSLSLHRIERLAWEEVYAKSLYKHDESALQLLRDRYRSLPDGTEKLYIVSRIQGYFVLQGQPYYGEAAEVQDAYTASEQRFLEALNQEEALNYQNAEATYLAFYSEMKQQDDQDGLVLFEYHLCRLFQRHGRPYKARFYCSQMDQRFTECRKPSVSALSRFAFSSE